MILYQRDNISDNFINNIYYFIISANLIDIFIPKSKN